MPREAKCRTDRLGIYCSNAQCDSPGYLIAWPCRAEQLRLSSVTFGANVFPTIWQTLTVLYLF